MADHPIIFKSEMIRAIMTCAQCGTITIEIECPKCGSKDRCKTQTRRVIKRLPIHADYGEPDWDKTWIDDSYNPPCLKVAYGGGRPMGGTMQRHWCRHVPGDLLWVKESHWISTCKQYIAMPGGSRNHYSIPPDSVCSTKSVSTDIRSSGRRFELQDGSVIHAGSPVGSKGEKDMLNCVVMIDGHRRDLLFRRRSPLFMPKRACRLWLKVKSVRVERVQEIRACDIEAEGIDISADGIRTANHFRGDAWELWQTLWDSINAKPKPRYRTINGKKKITHYESYPWENIHQTRRHRGKPWHVYGNPHVFATEFERYEQ